MIAPLTVSPALKAVADAMVSLFSFSFTDAASAVIPPSVSWGTAAVQPAVTVSASKNEPARFNNFPIILSPPFSLI